MLCFTADADQRSIPTAAFSLCFVPRDFFEQPEVTIVNISNLKRWPTPKATVGRSWVEKKERLRRENKQKYKELETNKTGPTLGSSSREIFSAH